MQNNIYYFLWCCAILGLALSDTCTWDNCPNWSDDDNAVYVHFVPHTHDDMGWLKTADDYYTGANPKQVNGLTGVNMIISTMVDELAKDPKRRFSYCETGYLTRWIEDAERTEIEKEKLRSLVASGQLEFIGGGWVQPDEAATHYVDLIDQYSLGLRKLNDTFGPCGRPKVAWQIDPFGHSREHGNLVKSMGYEGLFFAREHYLEHQMRRDKQNLEFNWTVSDDNQNQLFTGVFYDGYGPPSEFCWDARCTGSDPIVTDPNMENYNVEKIYNDFVTYLLMRASSQPHKHFLMVMGSDFQYTNSKMWFSNLDKLINHINSKTKDTGMTAFYSTPSCYMNAVKEYMGTGAFVPENKTTDFFPYASSENAYWTGYFTSKPAMKGLIRQSSSLLQLTRQMNVFALSNDLTTQSSSEEIFERSIALAQHHDGITGTSKEFVTQDYERRILNGWTESEKLLNIAVERISQRSLNNGFSLPKQTMCRTINETDCVFVKYNDKYVVTVYNPSSKEVVNLVKIPYYGATEKDQVTVSDNRGTILNHTISPTFTVTEFGNSTQLQSPTVAPFQLWFSATIGPLGFKSYFVDTNGNTRKALKKRVKLPIEDKSKSKIASNNEVTISNQFIKLSFENGQLYQLQDLQSPQQDIYNISQSFLWYQGADNINKQQASGAYVFRPEPNTTAEEVLIDGLGVLTHVVQNDLFQEVQQTFNFNPNWVIQSVRLYNNKPYVEFEYTVGPLPSDLFNLKSHEVITRYTVNSVNDISFTNNGIFTTDSNGRQYIKRTRDSASDYTYDDSEPIASNYYPINTRIILTDENKIKSLVVLTDRSQAGGSLEDGQLEILVHRRDFFDDGFGVNEPLNEPGRHNRGLIIRGKHWLILTDKGNATKMARTIAQDLFYSPIVTFSQYSSINAYTSNYLTQFSGLSKPFPDNVNLLTLKQLSPTNVLIRIEHIFQKNEDTLLDCGNVLGCSAPVKLNLSEYFNTFNIISAKELTLAGNDWINNSDIDITGIVLNPMEIRTFQLQVQSVNNMPGQNI